jgi:hypothetical protein
VVLLLLVQLGQGRLVWVLLLLVLLGWELQYQEDCHYCCYCCC